MVGQITRAFFLCVAAIGGAFMLIFSAAFALFAVAAVAIVGFLVFAGFWLRAKILGKPFGPRAQFEAARRDMEEQMQGQFQGMDLDMKSNGPLSKAAKADSQGPIIDAHQTPEGWSVDD